MSDKQCKNCIYWKQFTEYEYENISNSGKCSEIIDSLVINIECGWDGGYVESIETEEGFYCKSFSNK